MTRPVITLVAVLLLLAAGCTTDPGLDKTKFAELDRAKEDLKAALGSGERCEVPDSVLERLGAGTAALAGRTASKAERDLLAAYADLVAISRDAQLLCRSRTHLTGFRFVPKGRIYVTQELDPVVERYGLPVERHVYEPTGASWRSISADSIGMLWERAATRMKSIEVMQKYS